MKTEETQFAGMSDQDLRDMMSATLAQSGTPSESDKAFVKDIANELARRAAAEAARGEEGR